MAKIELVLVRGMEALKRLFRCHTWQVELAIVFIVLALVAIGRLIITGHGWVEWIGALAVVQRSARERGQRHEIS